MRLRFQHETLLVNWRNSYHRVESSERGKWKHGHKRPHLQHVIDDAIARCTTGVWLGSCFWSVSMTNALAPILRYVTRISYSHKPLTPRFQVIKHFSASVDALTVQELFHKPKRQGRLTFLCSSLDCLFDCFEKVSSYQDHQKVVKCQANSTFLQTRVALLTLLPASS